MKKIKFACNLSLLTLFALGQWACEWDPYEHDSDPVRINEKKSRKAV